MSDERADLTIHAIVPIGQLDGAKSRLGAVLDAEERFDLVTRLAVATLAAVVATPGIAETLVVTPDDEVRRLALAAGARPIRQRTTGLNDALREARDEAIAAGADAILIVPTDLPAVSPDALAAVIAALPNEGPAVVLVPDRHDRGTNVLLLAPPDVIDVRFGRESRAAHVAAAREAGAMVVELDGELRLDIDTPEDLLAAQDVAPGLVHG